MRQRLIAVIKENGTSSTSKVHLIRSGGAKVISVCRIGVMYLFFTLTFLIHVKYYIHMFST